MSIVVDELHLWVSDGGSEYNVVLATAGLVLILTGPGAYSLDALLGVTVPATFVAVAAVLTLLGVAAALASRRAPEAQRT